VQSTERHSFQNEKIEGSWKKLGLFGQFTLLIY
jgi:hypothetical protein